MKGKERLSKEQRAAARELLHLQVIPRKLLHKAAFQKHPIDFIHLLSVAKIYQHFIARQVKNTWQLSALLGDYEALLTRFPGSSEENNDGTFQDYIKTKRDKENWTVFNFAAMSGSHEVLSKLSQHYRFCSRDPKHQLDHSMILLIGSMQNKREWSNALADFVSQQGFSLETIDRVQDQETYFCIDHFAGLAGNLSYFIPTHYSNVELVKYENKRIIEALAQKSLAEGDSLAANSLLDISKQTTIRNEQPVNIFHYSSTLEGILPIHCAAAAGQVNCLFEILQNDPQMLLKKDHRGCTLLHHVAINGQYITFDYLYPLYAEHLYIKDNKGFTPLDHLIMNMKIRSPDIAQKTGIKITEIPINYALTLRQIHLLRMMKYKYHIDHTRSPV